MQPETTTETVGTSLQLLAPYLPYTLQVQLVDNECTGRLLGLSTAHTYQLEAIVEVATQDGPQRVGCACSKLLPILRPFSALAEADAEGAIAAVELAKRYCVFDEADSQYYRPDWQTVTVAQHPDLLIVRWIIEEWYQEGPEAEWERGDDLHGVLRIYADWTAVEETEEGYIGIAPAYVDYLRSLHFAVGLESHQYLITT